MAHPERGDNPAAFRAVVAILVLILASDQSATGGRALLRLLCPRHCVGRFSDHTLASDAHLHTCGAGTRGLIIVRQ